MAFCWRGRRRRSGLDVRSSYAYHGLSWVEFTKGRRLRRRSTPTMLNLFRICIPRISFCSLFQLCTSNPPQVWLFTTDKGGDEALCGKLIRRDINESLRVQPSPTLPLALHPAFFIWHWHIFCMLHQIHLIVMRQLSRLGTYFSDLSKCVHTWRAPKMSSQIHSLWEKKFGAARAKQAVNHVTFSTASKRLV